jgi:hypothetical protein
VASGQGDVRSFLLISAVLALACVLVPIGFEYAAGQVMDWTAGIQLQLFSAVALPMVWLFHVAIGSWRHRRAALPALLGLPLAAFWPVFAAVMFRYPVHGP